LTRSLEKGRRSLFIAEATRERLQSERFLKILEETQGTWSDKNHPGLKTARDMERFIRDKRQSYRKRLKRITKHYPTSEIKFHPLPPVELH